MFYLVFRQHARVVCLLRLREVEVGHLGSIVNRHKGEGYDAVKLLPFVRALVGQVPVAVVALRVRFAQGRLVVFRNHHAKRTEGLVGHLVDGSVLDTGLLDAHIHDVGRVTRQGQVRKCLHHKQAHDQRNRARHDFQIADDAHGSSFHRYGSFSAAWQAW